MRNPPIALILASFLSLAPAALAQEPLLPPTVGGVLPPPPPLEKMPTYAEPGADDELIPLADIDLAIDHGFTRILIAERETDERTAIIRKEFVIPLEAAVGQGGNHPFEWALIDLTGDGYSDLVLTSRAPGLRDGDQKLEGVRMLVYAFDGRAWNRILDGTGMEIAYKDSQGPDGETVNELALIQPRSFIVYRLQDGKYVRTHEVKRELPQ